MRTVRIAAALTTLLAAGAALSAPTASDARVVLVDRATARATAVSANSSYGVAWASGGTSLLVNGGGGLNLVEVTRSGSATRVVRRLRGVTTFGPEGRSVENVGEPGRGFRVLDHTGRVTARVAGRPQFPDAVAWSLDGRRVAMLTEQSDHTVLVVVDADLGSLVLRVRLPYDTSLAPQAFAPDGSALVLSVGDTVARLDLLTGTRRTLRRVKSEEGAGVAVWGATGDIAVRTARRVLVLRPGAPSRLVAMLRVRASSDLSWTPDGRALSFVQTEDLPGLSPLGSAVSVRLVRAAPGARLRTLRRPSTELITATAWSPDGRTLAIMSG